MIAGSRMELQPVLDAIAERAAKLCEAEDAAIYRVDGSFSPVAAHFGPIPLSHAATKPASLIVAGPLVVRLWTARRSMSMTFEQPKPNFPAPKRMESL
jgi:two-component system NtrC family sensor kinase